MKGKKQSVIIGTIEVQPVTPRQKKLCKLCGVLPQRKRMVQTKGGGKFQTQNVFCATCGLEVIQVMVDELEARKKLLLMYTDDEHGEH